MPKKVVIVPPKEEISPPRSEGLPEWMATFADMVTLLLCFFVLLLSFAKQDLDKFRDVLGSIQNAFGSQIEREAADNFALSPLRKRIQDSSVSPEDKVLLGVILRIRSLIEEDYRIKQSAGVDSEKDGAVVYVGSEIIFYPGTARMKPEAASVLDKIIIALREYNYRLVVRGHTDATRHPTTAYPSNWELSAARAAVALNYIITSGGISPARLKAVGYADTRPRFDPDDPTQAPRNNRVEFFFHRAEEDAW